MTKLIKYVLTDILRNRFLIGYTACLMLLSFAVLNLDENSSKGLLSLLNLVLLLVPLVSLVFCTIYMYNSAEFIELLVSQPIRRTTIWLSFYIGLTAAFSLAWWIGAGIPVWLYTDGMIGWTMMLTGWLLSVIFVSIALLASAISRDKARGIGLVVLLWLYFSLLFDGLLLFLLFQFSDYPMEKPMLLLTILNPIDLGRILILMQMDAAALMGYSGAVFKSFFGSPNGWLVSVAVMICWIWLPLWISMRRFQRKDL